MATSRPGHFSEVHFNRDSCKIILKHGDLLAEADVDIIVIPTPDSSDGNPTNYALFSSIYKKANEAFKRRIDDTRSKLSLLKPQIISEKDRNYILSVPPHRKNETKAREFLEKTYISCLELATKNKYRKIAFPTIGCGVIGFNSTDAAGIIYHSLENFQLPKRAKLDEIRIVIYDVDVHSSFTNIFFELSNKKNSMIKLDRIIDESSTSSTTTSTRDSERIPENQRDTRTTNDDDDDSAAHRSSDNRQPHVKTSSLNPEAETFQLRAVPKKCRYQLSNRRAELIIRQADITETKADAIVNGVDNFIHKVAGKQFLDACRESVKTYSDKQLPIGRSRILLSYKMSPTTSYIINTMAPSYDTAKSQECSKQLISCYKTCLALAKLYDLETIAFPAISCGEFGYPVEEAAEVALKTVDQEADDMRQIIFVISEDFIYNEWVKKADELNFTSLDVDRPKQSTSNLLKTEEHSTSDNKSTSAKTDKVSESSGHSSHHHSPASPGETSDSQENDKSKNDHQDSKTKTSQQDKKNDQKNTTPTHAAQSSNNNSDRNKLSASTASRGRGKPWK